ncbi:uncharacterized protein LOC143567571 [Bidens hawaiensis]|uniref:uncharacterized protein LOC143567571 n=1 Tax=Bidens hawaiensis TaxID=980011 RepID=UPI00404A30C9
MKNSQMSVLFGLMFLFGLLQIPSSNAFSETNPLYNVNLTPFIQRLSAYYCLKNVSSDCPGNFTLTYKGWLNISESETKAFCEGGCLQHTRYVLRCAWTAHKGYKFDNGASIENLNDTINIGCDKGFNGTSLWKNSGTTTTAGVTLYALVVLVLFYM